MMTRKEIDTQEWYDFIGELSGVLPGIHLGGENATKELVSLCHIDETSYVLDVGCGSGNTACEVAKEYHARVVGIDLSEAMIRKAIERAKKEDVADKVDFRVQTVFELPFSDHTFDVALSESVLTPLLGEKINAIREIVRVLRPSGLLGINESIVDFEPSPEIIELLDKHPAINGFFTTSNLRQLIENSGLKIIEFKEYMEPSSTTLREIGFRNLLSFMLFSYPKVIWKLLRDSRFRRAQKVDNMINKHLKEYGGYVLLVGQKS
ncbi:MAG: class I SAM-dependent methyltransferase [Candidatus Thorarchaeota archaeon]